MFANGLLAGHIQAVDSAFVKANASPDRLSEKQFADPPTLHLAGEPMPDVPAPAPAAVIYSLVHQLQGLVSTYAWYLRNTSSPL
jgi:hypothetical protein